MPSTIRTSGLGGQTLPALLRQTLRAAKPNVMGLAIAYVSRYGFEFALKLLTDHQVQHVRLVADTHDAITHPAALAAAMKAKWDVRAVNAQQGTFHPKLWIAGKSFSESAFEKGFPRRLGCDSWGVGLTMTADTYAKTQVAQAARLRH